MRSLCILVLVLAISTILLPLSPSYLAFGEQWSPTTRAPGSSEVRLEIPFAVYEIRIPLGSEILIVDLGLPGRCYSEDGARVQQLSPTKYMVSAPEERSGSSFSISCVMTPFEINRSSVRAVLAPVIINGSPLAISMIWFPQYVVNVNASPTPDSIYPSGDGYYMLFNSSDPRPVSIQGFIFSSQRSQGMAQPSSAGKALQDPLASILMLVGGSGAGAAAMYVLHRARSRFRRRDLEKEILDLLARSQRGMSLSMISKELGSPKSSTWKRLRKLVESGVVEEFEGPGKGKLYRLRKR